MSARNPMKCPICAKSNRVSVCANFRAKIWRYFAREDLAEVRQPVDQGRAELAVNGPSWRQCTAYLCLQPYCTTAAGLRHRTPATAAAAPGGIVLSASALRVFRRRWLFSVLQRGQMNCPELKAGR